MAEDSSVKGRGGVYDQDETINDDVGILLYLFFFSSRRRHTRSYGDWSSDVCSSDLSRPTRARSRRRSSSTPAACSRRSSAASPASPSRSSRWRTSTSSRGRGDSRSRSEERRVGKECRSGRSPSQEENEREKQRSGDH